MKRHTLSFGLLVMALLTTPLWAATEAKIDHDNMLVDFAGQPHQLADYTGKGKWLVVMIWVSDCHVCNAEVGNYDRYYRENKDMNVAMLGISMDGWRGRDAAMAFIRRHKVSFPNLIGTRSYVTQLYMDLTGVFMRGTPAFLIYDPAGRLRAQQVGGVPVKLIRDFIRRNSKSS